MKRVVMWSGGITSWATARWVADEHGIDDLVLLFADTLAEDEDLYRFSGEAAAQLEVEVTRVADGRTPWQTFHDERFIGNSRIAPCSKLLKQKPCRNWLRANTDPADTVLYVGIDWTELHRLPAIVRGWTPWTVAAPLTEPPYRDKTNLINEARELGIEPPRLYRLGFPHNNCAGACVRGGQAQWAHLLRQFPDRYATAEIAEQDLRAHLGADASVLRSRVGGQSTPLTLAALRTRIEDSDQDPIDGLDWGGCGCFTEESAASMDTRRRP